MKLKIMINLKKFISVLLCSILISSTLPCGLLNTTVSAVRGPNDVETQEILEIKHHRIAYIIVPKHGNKQLKENDDFEIDKEEGKIILKKSYIKQLEENVDFEIDKEKGKVIFKDSYIKQLEPDSSYYAEIFMRPGYKDIPAFNKQIFKLPTQEIKTYRKDQQSPPDDAKFNNLKPSYTYGDVPGTISLNGGSGTGAVTYKSSNPDVAIVDENTGELTIIGTGDFTITATKAEDEKYTALEVTSDPIHVNKRPVTINNIKIKNKIYDKTNLAEFNGTPILEGAVDGDYVQLVNGTPIFSDINVGNNIPINFSPLFSLKGTDAENYYIIQTNNIYGNIISEFSYKEDKKSNITPHSNNAKDNSSNNLTLDSSSAFNNSENSNLDNSKTQPQYEPQYDSDKTTPNDDQDEIFEAEDDLTKIQVYAPKGIFPKWSRLVVREMYPNTNEYSDTYKNLDEKIKNKIENIKLYEIHVVNQDGEVIQPNISKGLMTVRIPIPNDYDLADLQIYRIKQDADDDFDETIININARNY